MARRTKDELLAEFHRLYDIFETADEFRLRRLGVADAERDRGFTPTRERMLTQLGQQGVTLSQLIAGTREAINDTSEMYGDPDDSRNGEARAFHAFYRERTGRDWFADAGNPAKMARAILQRGRIRDETEWRLLTAVLADTEQTVLAGADAARAEAMLTAFEDAAPTGTSAR